MAQYVLPLIVVLLIHGFFLTSSLSVATDRLTQVYLKAMCGVEEIFNTGH